MQNLRKKPTFNELINYLEFEQPKVQYPDRTATFLRNSNYLTQFDGPDIDVEGLYKQQQKQTLFNQALQNAQRAPPNIGQPQQTERGTPSDMQEASPGGFSVSNPLFIQESSPSRSRVPATYRMDEDEELTSDDENFGMMEQPIGQAIESIEEERSRAISSAAEAVRRNLQRTLSQEEQNAIEDLEDLQRKQEERNAVENFLMNIIETTEQKVVARSEAKKKENTPSDPSEPGEETDEPSSDEEKKSDKNTATSSKETAKTDLEQLEAAANIEVERSSIWNKLSKTQRKQPWKYALYNINNINWWAEKARKTDDLLYQIYARGYDNLKNFPLEKDNPVVRSGPPLKGVTPYRNILLDFIEDLINKGKWKTSVTAINEESRTKDWNERELPKLVKIREERIIKERNERASAKTAAKAAKAAIKASKSSSSTGK